MSDGRTAIPLADDRSTSTDLVRTLNDRANLAATLGDPNVTLVRAAGVHILYKRKRLTEASQRGYSAILNDFTAVHPRAKLSDFEPPTGSHLVEEHLTIRYGHLGARTYNKAHSVLSDFFKWQVARGTLARDPAITIERAKTRPVQRQTFTDLQVGQILEANREPRDQIALRLLLFFGIRKGALRRVQLDSFNVDKRHLTILTKGEKFQTIPIVDERVWLLLDDLREPGHHFLLPKQTTRKRTPPTRESLTRLGEALGAARGPLQAAAADAKCARELAELLDTLELADVRLSLAIDAASTQTAVDLTAPIGEHGMHLLWYRWLARAGIVAKGQTAGRRMHSARHTSIQRVLEKTGNLKAAQALAGHANISTTGDTYTDWSLDQQADTMRKVLA